jgi:hypothetical protein
MMNKTGPNFLKSSKNINLDESLESERLDEMHSFINEQPTSVSRRKASGTGFPMMPSISSAGNTTGRIDPQEIILNKI